MNRDEYLELMQYLSAERIRRSKRGRHRYHFMEMQMSDELIEEMARGYSDHKRGDREDATLDAQYIQAVRQALSLSTDIAEEIGMIDVVEEYQGVIIEGMAFGDLPAEDLDALRTLGEVNARGALLAAFHKVKHRGSVEPQSQRFEQTSLVQSLRSVESRLVEASNSLQSSAAAPSTPKHPSRRWFKGLGKIAQGAALTLADVCMAGGLLILPVSPETQSWGAIVSSITGIGTVLEGAGELRGE